MIESSRPYHDSKTKGHRLTWPDDWKETLRSRSGYHHKDVLGNRVLDCDEEYIANDLDNLDPNPSHP